MKSSWIPAVAKSANRKKMWRLEITAGLSGLPLAPTRWDEVSSQMAPPSTAVRSHSRKWKEKKKATKKNQNPKYQNQKQKQKEKPTKQRKER